MKTRNGSSSTAVLPAPQRRNRFEQDTSTSTLIAGQNPEVVLADKAYDLRQNREAIHYDWHLHKQRNVVERCFGRIKQYRRVATRYDKKATNYLRFVWLASIAMMLA